MNVSVISLILIVGAVVVGTVGGIATACRTEHITWREAVRRLVRGYHPPE